MVRLAGPRCPRGRCLRPVARSRAASSSFCSETGLAKRAAGAPGRSRARSGQPVHRPVRPHPRERPVDLRDGDRATPGDRHDVAAAELDPGRDRAEERSPTGHEPADGVRRDDGGVTDARLDELEQALVGGRENRTAGRCNRGGERPRAVAAAQSTRDPAPELAESREAREASAEDDRLVGAEVGLAEVGDRDAAPPGPDRRDREVPGAGRRRAAGTPAARRGTGRAGCRDAGRDRWRCRPRGRARESPRRPRTTPACSTGSPRSSATTSTVRARLDDRATGARRRPCSRPEARARR